MGFKHEWEKSLKKVGYSVEVSGSVGKKVPWKVVDNRVEDPKENGKIGLRGVDLIFFIKMRGGR